MRTLRLLRRRRALLNCAPISHDHLADRSMRAAVSRENGSDEFVNQQNFDRAVAEVIRLVPIPPESAEWFLDKEAIRAPRWTWRKIVLNPAVLAISIALVVIAGVFAFHLLGQLNDFPGSATARKLLTVAGSTRSVMLDMQFFLFPAERDTKTGAVLAFPGWRYVHQEGWVGAVKQHNGVCFMAVLKGHEKDLEPYLSKAKE